MNFSLKWTVVGTAASSPVFQTGAGIGPVWSDRGPTKAALMVDLNNTLAAVPYIHSQACSQAVQRTWPTFLVTLDLERALGVWEISVSPRVGVGYAVYTGGVCLE